MLSSRRAIFATFALLLFGNGCSDSNFSSKSRMKAPKEPGKSDLLPLPPAQSPPPEPRCEINLSYNPSEVGCHIPVNANHIWRNSLGWRDLVTAFPASDSANAGFISPLPFANGQMDRCPLVPGIEKLIYVSHIKVASAGRFSFSSIIDDSGNVRIWKNSDPRQEVINAVGNGLQLAAGSVELEPTGYAIVIDATDSGAITTGMAFTMADATGQVVKRSSGNDGWCIFRVPAGEDVASFVPRAAGCRPCFGASSP
jgi:hypothetical protein